MSVDILKLCLFFMGIIFSLFALFHSWRANYNGRLSVLLLIAGAFLLRISVSLDPFLHKWDERYHALVAKNLSGDLLTPKLYPEAPLAYDYKSWSDNYIWLHKQPLPLWAMAASVRCFGANEVAVRLPSVLLSTVAVFLTWLIGLWLFTARTGFWAAFFHSINGLIIEMTGGRVATDHVDVFFLVFVELGIFCAVLHWKRYRTHKKNRPMLLLATGASIGLAVLCKWLPALVVLPVFAALHWKNKDKWAGMGLILITAVAVFLPWQVYAALRFPQEYWYEMQYNSRHLTESLGERPYPWYFHFAQARIIWNELIYLPALWLIYSMMKSKGPVFPMLGIWIFLPYVFFSLSATKMPGYLLFTGPALFIVESAFITRILEAGRFRNLGLILTGLFFILALRYCFERAKPFNAGKEMANISFKVKSLGNQFKAGDKKVIFFNNSYSIETMFYTGILSYERLPKAAEIEYLIDRHYRIILFDGVHVPGLLREMEGVELYPNPF